MDCSMTDLELVCHGCYQWLIPPNSPIPTRRYEALPPENPKHVGGFSSRSGGEPRTHNLVSIRANQTRSGAPGNR